ncbi:MAG: YceI family protein [Sulfuricella sp.]|nr:YceI family protein [Sulfuricella sp.]
MKKTLLALTLTAALSAPAFAAIDNYTIDPQHTFPSFELSHLGFSTQRGRFDHTAGKIALDAANKSGSISVIIDAASIDTGLPDLEKHLRSDDFFDVEKYPTITFVSNKLRFSDGKLVGADGEFTLHGITRPVNLKLDHFACGPHPMTKKMRCGANATTTIKRSEFGIAKYVPLVGDEVKIAIQVEAEKD